MTSGSHSDTTLDFLCLSHDMTLLWVCVWGGGSLQAIIGQYHDFWKSSDVPLSFFLFYVEGGVDSGDTESMLDQLQCWRSNHIGCINVRILFGCYICYHAVARRQNGPQGHN